MPAGVEPEALERVRHLFPFTDVQFPRREGEAQYMSASIITEVGEGIETISIVEVRRTIPLMAAPRGVRSIVFVDAVGDQVCRLDIPHNDDARVVNDELIIGNMLPIPVRDASDVWAIEGRSYSYFVDLMDPAEHAVAAVAALLDRLENEEPGLLLVHGVRELLVGLRSREFSALSDESVLSLWGDNAEDALAELPPKLNQLRIRRPTVRDIHIFRTPLVSYWECYVYVEVVPDEVQEERLRLLEFVVTNSFYRQDWNLVDRVLFVRSVQSR